MESPAFAVALAALVVALGGTAIAAGEIAGSDAPETVLNMRVTKDGKLIGTHNDGTVKKAGAPARVPPPPIYTAQKALMSP